MSEFKFFCSSCSQHILCDTGHSGMRINCPACQQAIVVPQAPTAPMPAPPSPLAPIYGLHPNPTSTTGRPDAVTPVAQPASSAQSRLWRTVLIIVIAVLILAGVGVGGWFGYAKFKLGNSSRGLIALWSGEGNANDSVGGCQGQPINGVGYAAGNVGQAFSFNGGNNIAIPDQPSLNPTNGITIACWAYSRRNSPMYGQVLVSKDGICRVGRQYLLVWGGGNDAPAESGCILASPPAWNILRVRPCCKPTRLGTMNSTRTARPIRRTGITSAALCAITNCNGISRKMLLHERPARHRGAAGAQTQSQFRRTNSTNWRTSREWIDYTSASLTSRRPARVQIWQVRDARAH
jgi:DNA-directed RNA polymerase subunit RPC12/RpoP